MAGGEDPQNLLQATANVREIGSPARRKGQRSLALVDVRFTSKMLPRARDGESIFIEKLLDLQNTLHVTTAIHALARAAFRRFQLRKLSFPKPKYVGRQMTKSRHFADAEVKLVRDQNFTALFRSTLLPMCGSSLSTHKVIQGGLKE